MNENKVGTHVTHCCRVHGCKYGDADCPVTTEVEKQKYPCEICPSWGIAGRKTVTVELQVRTRQAGNWQTTVTDYVNVDDREYEEKLDDVVEALKELARARQQLNRMAYRVQVVERTTALELPWPGGRQDAH